MMETGKNKNYLMDIWQKLGLDKLNSREKWVLGGGVAFVLGFIVLQLVINPVVDARSKLQKSITRKEQELVDIKLLQQEHLALKNEEGTIQARIQQRGGGFTLFTFLDRQADKAKVKKQIQYMKPSTSEGDDVLDETMVEMKLQQVTLESLVNFLRLVESEKNVVFIRRLSIQESGDKQGYLDSIMQIVTFELKG
ncbi:MAG: type II secretion system protein GspM [Desulforhopalus sp.]